MGDPSAHLIDTQELSETQKKASRPIRQSEGITGSGKLGNGCVCFWRNCAYEKEGRPFILVEHDVSMDHVGEVLHKEWKLCSPRIVLVLVSNVKPLIGWKNTRKLNNFLKGLVTAANTTNMWILTHGANVGIVKAVGDAVFEETLHRQSLFCHKHPNLSVPVPTPLTVIGVIREDMVDYAEILNELGRVEIENDGNRPEENKYELNPDHSHFIIIKDKSVNKIGANQFLYRLEQYIADTEELREVELDGDAVMTFDYKFHIEGSEVPVIAVLVQGGYDCARIVMQHLKNQLPVMVVQGSGGLADLIAYSYLELKHRTQGRWEPEFVENFLKPEISTKIVENFPRLRENSIARNIFRDRILECTRYAEQGQQTYLTILNIHSHTCDLTNLDEYILRALFKSQQPEVTKWYEQMEKDLYLTIDWNSPHVASNEVFAKDLTNKFKVSKEVFEQALLRPDRERFVNLFLNEGFKLHKYLTPKRLKSLFLRVQNQEFFQSVCWEGVLGHGMLSKIGKNFLEEDLNWLIETATGFPRFVCSQELSVNAVGMYIVSPDAAERKALTLLTMWAIFTNRITLAEVLWQNSDQPIHLALVISKMCDVLKNYTSESGYKVEMKKTRRKFSELAVGVLDISYKEATCRSFDVLSEESPDWSYKTAVELAADAQNRTFLSHPCCQKWLTWLFLGSIRIRELSWGFMKFPQWFKVLMCAFFIFPMYFWVRFKTDSKDCEPVSADYAIDSDNEKEGEHEGLIDRRSRYRTSAVRVGSIIRSREDEKELEQEPPTVVTVTHPPLWRMIYLMWSAPVTKLWTFQVFYMIYLGLFSLAVLWPSCGNYYLDITVCAWTSLMVVETIRRTYRLYRKYSSIPLFLKCCEILLIIAFVCLYAMGRIYQLGAFYDPYSGKVLLCLGLLYFYYRLIAIYLPISPTLGPLLYRVRLMVTVDFINFMRMTLLVIISCGVVIHATIYPDYPLTSELFRRTFHRAWFSMFLTPIADLEAQDRCHNLWFYRNSSDTCHVGNYKDYTCPTTGVWPYIFSIQYFILLKLILLTLLYAIFSATASKIQDETDAIWKFQRYQLVVDFANRLRLPAPLSIFSYLAGLGEWIYRGLCCIMCRKSSDTTDKPEGGLFGKDLLGLLQDKDYNYWKELAQEYCRHQEEKIRNSDIPKKQMELLTTIAEDVDYEKNVMTQIRGQMRELERMMNQAQVVLEDLKKMSQKDESVQISLHYLARQSPYQGTAVQRFPVPDKYVAWEVLWVEYDPVIYSQHRSQFPIHLQPFVDDDILLLLRSKCAVPVLKWNSLSVNAAGFSIDRQSWIPDSDGRSLVYRLNGEGLPVNPLGRTGLRGKGALPRWGPNHYIFVVITRWQKTTLLVKENKTMEFIALFTADQNHISLPGGFASGENKFDIIRGLFKSEAESSTPWRSAEDMTQFFENCITPPKNEESRSDVKCEVVERGYMDDPLNTDHAWREVELWSIHYEKEEEIAEKLQMNLSWRVVTEDVFLKLPLGQAMLLQKIIELYHPLVL
ncbi:transient receptor potential cation channel subfamily M member-like 2 isoform X4 [Tachypleus tridentatus]|uniref:transient receptor potential cation channel subfamily M member-like 2 isoform X4 n=1 Tax=Tachypleus tridentatus TaxID=6853 RepID=UPI003FD47F50